MSENNSQLSCKHSKSKQQIIIKENLYYCFACSSIVLENQTFKENKIITAIKPEKFKNKSEVIPLFLSKIERNLTKVQFINKMDYVKIRSKIIKNMNSICNNFKLSKKTYFLSTEYLDRICSQLIAFDMQTIWQISVFCIILATKYQESSEKSNNLQNIYKNYITSNYINDEIYFISLLKYDLNLLTSYDFLLDLMNCGFIFTNEIISLKKISSVYNKLELMLFAFSETKYYIEMTPIQLVTSLCGFVRESLGFEPFNIFLLSIFNNKDEIEKLYICLNTIRNCFVIKSRTKHKIQKQYEKNNNISNITHKKELISLNQF